MTSTSIHPSSRVHCDAKATSKETSVTAGSKTGPLSELAQKIDKASQKLRDELRNLKGDRSHWKGELSVSALSTATAISALAIAKRETERSGSKSPARWTELITNGCAWLKDAQNMDGGFGDTDRSLSNIATSLLVIAAWDLAEVGDDFSESLARAKAYVAAGGGWDGLRRRYGKDKTFVVPIMTNCALAGQIEWSKIPTLPFEAAALPQAWYRFAKMPVVSYAVPALVAIGQAQWVHNPPRNPVSRLVRGAVRQRTLNVLRKMQPESGGYLEATPLTSFVLMNLASIGLVQHPVSQESIRFLVESVTEEGCWPIDTNLATWVTSLTTRTYYPSSLTSPSTSEMSTCDFQAWGETIDWILSCQHRVRHPFTGAEPGGWGWTDLSGSVPDSDDTPAALLALARYRAFSVGRLDTLTGSERDLLQARLDNLDERAVEGIRWLVRLQNRDGGWPTFCKGWGLLPFDRSGSDLTAHVLRAIHAWRDLLPAKLQRQVDRATQEGWRFLEKNQQSDGSWQPLWFGNQDRPEEDNPFYGTARVLMAYGECGKEYAEPAIRGVRFLKSGQNADGSWGGGMSISYAGSGIENGSALGSGTLEETAVVLESLISCRSDQDPCDPIMKGLVWVCDAVESDYHHESQPIGFYFAKLWYHEKQYPFAFSLAALRKGLEFCQR